MGVRIATQKPDFVFFFSNRNKIGLPPNGFLSYNT